MQQKRLQPIEESPPGLKRLEDCKTCKGGTEVSCKGKDVGLASLTNCLEGRQSKCTLWVDDGALCYCSCPIRVHKARKRQNLHVA
jgi:hypothetical protein